MAPIRTLTLTLVGLMTAGLGVAAPVEADPRDRTRTYLIDPAGPAADDVFPEGVAVEEGRFYVGSTTDGTIYRGRVKGDTASPFLPGGQDGRTSAIGLKAEDHLLFVAGGPTGRLFIYDLDSRDLVGSFQVDPPPTETNPTFINDLVVAPDGSVYATDSLRPFLYRVPADGYATDGVEPLPVFLDFTGTALTYQDGFNVNGIVATRNGRALVLAQSNTGTLFRVSLPSRDVAAIELGEAVSGDGLLLRGRKLYAVERQGDLGFVVKIRLARGLLSGTVRSRTTDPTFNDPTTAAFARGRMLVVNSQFGERAAGVEPDDFTVSSIPRP